MNGTRMRFLMIVVLCFALMPLLSRCAHAAQFVELRWPATDPGSSATVTFEAQRGSMQDGWAEAKLYRSPNASDPFQPIPAPQPGDTLHAFVSITVSPNVPYGSRRGGQSLRVRPVPVGVALPDSMQVQWSNLKDVLAGARDTLWTNGRAIVYPVAGLVTFVRAFGDSTLDAFGAPGPIACYEDALYKGYLRSRICGIFRDQSHPGGYYCKAGARVNCP